MVFRMDFNRAVASTDGELPEHDEKRGEVRHRHARLSRTRSDGHFWITLEMSTAISKPLYEDQGTSNS
jgi:hypothetical protein